MPTFDICKGGYNADCSSFFIDDNTEYGVAPDDRASFALFLVGFFYNTEGEDASIVIDNSLPLTVSQWEIPSSSDGYNYFDLLAVDIYDINTVYNTGDVVYENTFYWKSLTDANESNTPTNNEDTFWERVTDLYAEVSGDIPNASITVTRQDEVNLCRADICYGQVIHKAANDNCKNCQKFVYGDVVKVDTLLQSAYILTAQTRYTEAHKVALLLMDICNDLTDCGCS